MDIQQWFIALTVGVPFAGVLFILLLRNHPNVREAASLVTATDFNAARTSRSSAFATKSCHLYSCEPSRRLVQAKDPIPNLQEPFTSAPFAAPLRGHSRVRR